MDALILARRLLNGRNAKHVMNGFRKLGIIDPVSGVVQAKRTRQDNDFALISLAQNPFADTVDYVCIMVAGIHGPGTAHAVRMLAEDDFREHPLGGIIEFELNLFKDWPTRFEQAATSRWETRRYTIQELRINFEHALEQPARERTEAFKNLTEQESKGCLEFIRNISGSD
jgi:hypothetical protein